MKKGQKLTKNGIQCLGFPMEHENITQGNGGVYSHRGVNAIDNAGKDGGIDETIVPCDCRVKFIDSPQNGNAVFMESTKKVMFADGDIDYATLMYIHDNYIGDIARLMRQGYVFKQGETIGDEGTAGRATGNHCHIEVAKGRYTHAYDRNKYGVWHLPHSIQSDHAFFIDGTVQKTHGKPSGSGKTMHWKHLKDVEKAKKKKSYKTIANEVLDGKWGNGKDRINRLKKAGYDPKKVQAEVNKRYGM